MHKIIYSTNKIEETWADINCGKIYDNIEKLFKLKTAIDPLNILEDEIISWKHLKVTWLANCLGIALVDSKWELAVVSHIFPFGWEKYDKINQINKWTNIYINQLIYELKDNNPSVVILRSREIWSRPLFHGRMIEQLKINFPNSKFDIQNSTYLEIKL